MYPPSFYETQLHDLIAQQATENQQKIPWGSRGCQAHGALESFICLVAIQDKIAERNAIFRTTESYWLT